MVNLKHILVVVADAAQAKIFIVRGPHQITQIDYLQHAASRLTNQDLTCKEHDMNTTPYERQDSMKEHEKFSFARELARIVEKALERDNLTDLCIIAAPHFLGEIHKNLVCKNTKITSINKDLLSANDDKILADIRAAGITFLPT